MSKQSLGVNDVLKQQLLEDADGVMYVLSGKDLCRLAGKKIKYKGVVLEVAVGPARVKHHIDGIVLSQGCRFLWSSISVCTVLCLTPFKGEGSKWAYEMGDGWQRRLLQYGITGQACKSARGSSFLESEDGTPGFAPFSCIATVALIHLPGMPHLVFVSNVF